MPHDEGSNPPDFQPCAGVECPAEASEVLLGRPRCRRHARSIHQTASRWDDRAHSEAEVELLSHARVAPWVLSSSEQVINASRNGEAELPPALSGALGISAWSWRSKQSDRRAAYEHNRLRAAQRPWRWPRWVYLVARGRPTRLTDERLLWLIVGNIEHGHLIKWEHSDGGAFYATPGAAYSYELDGSFAEFPRPCERPQP